MRNSWFVLPAALVLLATSARADDFQLDASTQVVAPVSYKNLTLYPLVSTAATKPAGDYLSLDEGFDKGVVKVHEKGNGEVNTLTLENKSKKSLFVMSGEVVIGGRQDRIIGKDTVIGPSQSADIPVFCVEHGRWTGAGGDGKQFTTARAMAHSKLRVQANGHDNQGQVWDEVQSKNAARGTENETGTYRQVATGKKGVDDLVKPYVEYFGAALGKVAHADQMIGVVVALNGQIIGIEQFGAPALFAKERDKLLRSYYVDAVDAPVDATAKAPQEADIKAFENAAAASPTETVVDHGPAKTERKKGKGVIDNEVKDPAAAPAVAPIYKSIEQDR